MKITGIIIMLLGLVLTVVMTVSYFTQEKIVQVGSLKLTQSQPQYFSWLPFIGLAVTVIGAFFILQARKN